MNPNTSKVWRLVCEMLRDFGVCGIRQDAGLIITEEPQIGVLLMWDHCRPVLDYISGCCFEAYPIGVFMRKSEKNIVPRDYPTLGDVFEYVCAHGLHHKVVIFEAPGGIGPRLLALAIKPFMFLIPGERDGLCLICGEKRRCEEEWVMERARGRDNGRGAS